MKNRAILALILSFALLFASIPFIIFAEGEAVASETNVKSEIPYCDSISGVTAYGNSGLTAYTAEEAASAGVPEGFTGHVVAISTTNTSGLGITLDFSQIMGDIAVENIKSMTMRVWYPSTAYEVRLTPDAKTYYVRYGNGATIPTGQWVDITVYADGTGFDNAAYNFTKFADADGNLAPLNLVFRLKNVASGATTTAYIDSITLDIDDPDAGKNEIPYCDSVEGVSTYGYTTLDMMTATEASAAEVPAGYSDHVMKLTHNSTGIGLTIDPAVVTGEEIKLADLESITVRAYLVGENVKNTRATIDGGTGWILNTTPTGYDQWIEYTVPVSSLAYEDDETVSPFCLAFRFTNNTETTVYIDSVTFKLKDVEETTVEETTAAPEPEKPYYTFEEGMGKDEIPYGATASVGTSYGYSSFMMMDAAQAAAAGVPEGYSGWVLALGANSGGNLSIGLDLTSIHTMDLERISFRLWCPTGTKQDEGSGGIRISGSTSSAWNMLVAPTTLNAWIDVVLEKDDFSSFDFDGDGYCDLTNFCLRGATGTAYIDHITVDLRDPDTVPPVITYNGDTVIETREGREFVLDISAHDAYYDVDVALEYIWSEGAMVDGELVSGNHTCTVRATDEAGNTSEIELTVNVGERDTEAPTVSQLPTEMYAMSGAKISLEVSVSDNVDNVDAVFTWSEGALDAAGRLCVGDHTLTVSATDLTGNTSEQVITVHVLETRPIVGDVIQDS